MMLVIFYNDDIGENKAIVWAGPDPGESVFDPSSYGLHDGDTIVCVIKNWDTKLKVMFP